MSKAWKIYMLSSKPSTSYKLGIPQQYKIQDTRCILIKKCEGMLPHQLC